MNCGTQLFVRFLFTQVLSFCVGISAPLAQEVIFERSYGKVESRTGEHCDGWIIELWKASDGYIGHLTHHRALCGDPPMGILEDVRYDPKTKAFSFQTTITDGSDGFGSLSCDHLNFKGSMDDHNLIGTIAWESNGKQLPSESIHLPRTDGNSSLVSSYNSRAEWKKSLDGILEYRGPSKKSKL